MRTVRRQDYVAVVISLVPDRRQVALSFPHLLRTCVQMGIVATMTGFTRDKVEARIRDNSWRNGFQAACRNHPFMSAVSIRTRRDGNQYRFEPTACRNGIMRKHRRWVGYVDGIRHRCRKSRRLPASFGKSRARNDRVNRVGRQW